MEALRVTAEMRAGGACAHATLTLNALDGLASASAEQR